MHEVVGLMVMLQVQASDSATYIGGNDGRLYLWIAMGVGVLALLAAGLLARSVIAQDTGTVEMQVISNAIREGAEAFLKRQYRTIGVIALSCWRWWCSSGITCRRGRLRLRCRRW